MRLDIPDEILPVGNLGRVHFIGIGGAGLSGIARLMTQLGISVSGSDQTDSGLLAALRDEGITCFVGHDAAHLDGVDTVIASTAVHGDNPEIVEAQRANPNQFGRCRSRKYQAVSSTGRCLTVRRRRCQ